MSSHTAPTLCPVPCASQSIFLSDLSRVWQWERVLGETRGLDGECTLLCLKERYPPHTQELDLSLFFLSPSSGAPPEVPYRHLPPRATLALRPHCVSG